jgi:glutamate racemase
MQDANNKGKIGFFDSGYGGLSILKNVLKELPEYDYVYLGDTARTPYGSRTQETIYQYTKQAMEYLIDQDCNLIVIACNSASAEALPRIQEELINNNHKDKRILGVIIPAAEDAVQATKTGEIGVIATSSSVASNAFVREIKKIDDTKNVHQVACPLLVPLVEADETDENIIESIIEKYLKNESLSEIDTLILGCTHYGLLKEYIEKVLKKIGKEVLIIDESIVVADKLKNYLERHPEIESNLSKEGKRIYYSTDLTDGFQRNASKFIGEEIEVQKINLD